MKLAQPLTVEDDTSASPTVVPLQAIWLLCVLVFLINYTFEVLVFNHLYEAQHFLLVLLQLSLAAWALTEVLLLERRRTAIPLKALRLTLIVQLLLGASRFPLGRLSPE